MLLWHAVASHIAHLASGVPVQAAQVVVCLATRVQISIEDICYMRLVSQFILLINDPANSRVSIQGRRTETKSIELRRNPFARPS
jgi:hypothetical protein